MAIVKLADRKRKAAKGENNEHDNAKPKLPFVTDKSLWAPAMSTKDTICKGIIGDEYALSYIALLKQGGKDAHYFALSRIIGDMVKAGHYGGIEISFVSTLAEVLNHYALNSMNVEWFRDWKRSRILSMLEMKWVPKATKLRVLEFLAETKEGKINDGK